MKKLLLLLFILISIAARLQAQTLLNENVNYKAGALTNALSGVNVSGGNWLSYVTGLPLKVPASGLSYPGYGSSGIGNSIKMTDTIAAAEDAYRQFPARTTGTVYCALLIKVTDTVGLVAYPTITSDYFSGFISSTNINAQVARLHIRKGSAGNTYQLGIRGNAGSNIVYV
ncbi:MAG: hypothetical protein V4651_05125, partial [Bacteroidota bacterium]